MITFSVENLCSATNILAKATRVLRPMLAFLLEQGSPIYDTKPFQKPLIRFLLACYYLSCLVLSNSYKNKNLSKIVLPRKCLRYDTLQQLVTDRFTIYTRAASMRFDSRMGKMTNDSKLQLIISQYNIRERNRLLEVESEVSTLIMDPIVISEMYNLSKFTLEMTLDKHARLHPETPSLLKIISDGIIKGNYKNRIERVQWIQYAQNLSNLYRGLEETVQLEEVKRCNKTAFVLPHDKTIELARHLVNSMIHGHIHVGKEFYFQGYHAFRLWGTIPPMVIERVKAIQTSGIMERWAGLTQNSTLVENLEGLVKPTMHGNILLVFVILGIGLGLSILGCIGEWTHYTKKVGRKDLRNAILVGYKNL